MKYDAIIIVDMQTALTEARPFQKDIVIANIKRICTACRKNNVPVIYVCHDGGAGDELEKDGAGWQVAKEIAPITGEKVINKQFNSAFRRTELHQYLQALHAKSLILCGMQTEFCFDVSCKVAFELEYAVTIPKDCTTTFDNEFATGEALTHYYEEKIWNHRYGNVISVDEVISNLEQLSI